jgi:hypothetical protein
VGTYATHEADVSTRAVCADKEGQTVMSDPSLLVGIWNYMFAVVWQWWGIIALVLGLMRVALMVFPASMGWVE